jgi:hypothetical protein
MSPGDGSNAGNGEGTDAAASGAVDAEGPDPDAGPAAADPARLPFDGTVLQLAAAKASVAPSRLPDLLAAVEADLGRRAGEYDRRFERVHEDPERRVYLVPADHWTGVGDRLGLGRREADAVRRTHEEQLLRLGSTTDRRDEFESALEIREAVVVGRAREEDDAGGPGDDAGG